MTSVALGYATDTVKRTWRADPGKVIAEHGGEWDH